MPSHLHKLNIPDKSILPEKFTFPFNYTPHPLCLTEALSLYAYKMRGVLSHPEHILITANFQSLLFIFMGLIPANSRIGMEYQEKSQAKRVFESYGFKIIEIRSNDDGIDLEDLKNKPIDLLYINSSCQVLKKNLCHIS